MANTSPIYSSAPDIQWSLGPITVGNTAYDGTGTGLAIFTADATNGGRVEKVRIKAAGTNVATVLRLYINNGGSSSTATNNILYEEITLAATTASNTTLLPNNEIILNMALPPGYRLTCTIGTTVAAGYYVTAFGGKY